MEKDDGTRLRLEFRLSGGGNNAAGKRHDALEIEAFRQLRGVAIGNMILRSHGNDSACR